MPKTPDEIKKGLECCITDNCKGCPYYPLYEVFGCKLARAKDALDLIQQLEAEKTKLLEESHEVRKDMLGRIRQLEAERDAAVEDLETVCGMCSVCCACKDRFEGGKACRGCVNSSHWNWRGVQKEE